MILTRKPGVGFLNIQFDPCVVMLHDLNLHVNFYFKSI